MGELGQPNAMGGVKSILETGLHKGARDVVSARRHGEAEPVRRRFDRSRSVLKVCALVVITASASAHANNNEPLVQLLAPANLALTLSNVCIAQDASFAGKATGEAGPIEFYAST